ncbi:hypothetical protein DAI22_03g359100 [Oryza sativa Japonica Group]|nr:hypothetical protein DAI22_03g359100 [Oryza sativa Japonica Group]
MVSSSAPRTGRPRRPQSEAERLGESGGRRRRLAPPSAAYALLPVAGLHPLPPPHPRNPHLRREAQPPLARSGSAPLPPCVGHHRLHGDLAVGGGHRRPRRSSPCHRAPYPLPLPSSPPPPQQRERCQPCRHARPSSASTAVRNGLVELYLAHGELASAWALVSCTAMVTSHARHGFLTRLWCFSSPWRMIVACASTSSPPPPSRSRRARKLETLRWVGRRTGASRKGRLLWVSSRGTRWLTCTRSAATRRRRTGASGGMPVQTSLLKMLK